MDEIYLRQRGKNRKSYRSILYFIIIVIIIIFIIYLIGSCGARAKATREYVTKTESLTTRINKVASEFNTLRENIGNFSLDEVEKKLANYENESNSISNSSLEISPPDELKKAHAYFTVSMDLRRDGLHRYRISFENALKDIDIQIAAQQMSDALKILSISDTAYNNFKKETDAIIKKYNLSETTFLSVSNFLPTGNEYEMSKVVDYINTIKSLKNLVETHDIAISFLALNPKKTATKNNIDVLASGNFIISVVVKNNGNKKEENIKVKATLKTAKEVEYQEQTETIASLSPKEEKSVTIRGLSPSRDGTTNMLTVYIEPVPAEKNTDDNIKEYEFMMK